MSVIVYRKYSFKEPAPISNEQFVYLKRQIALDATFEIGGEPRMTWTAQYKKPVRWFFIGVAVLAVALLLYRILYGFKKDEFGGGQLLVLLLIISSGATILISLVRLFLEGPSMATFLTDRRLYFCRMKHAIRSHADYPEFFTTFYGDGKTSPAALKAPFRQEALLEQKRAPRSMDWLLTRIFYRIDQYGWIVGLVIVVVFLIKRFIIK